MKIPKSFCIFGQKYHIEFDDKLVEKDNDRGQAKYRLNKIILQSNNSVVDRPQSQIEVIYLHELFHVIFHELDEGELGENEKLVELMANALHQILKTSEY